MLWRNAKGYPVAVRRVLQVLVVCIAAAMLVSGCGPGPDENGAGAVARNFYGALDTGNGAKACAELSPEARHKLVESAGTACAKAVTSLQLSGRTPRRVEVYGQTARVTLDSDTAFAAKFADGWRITAAGCKERPALPYDCQLES